MDKFIKNEILPHFQISLSQCEVKKNTQGKIHETYFIYEKHHVKYILQKINRSFLFHYDAMMHNFQQLIHYAGKDKHFFPVFIRSDSDEESYFFIKNGDTWRVLEYVPETISFNSTDNPLVVFEAGCLLAAFHRIGFSIPLENIRKNVPDFHSTKKHLTQLQLLNKEVVKLKHSDIGNLVDFIYGREKYCSIFKHAWNEQKIKQSFVHNDPKLSNMLFRNDNLQAVCLIDYDTLDTGFFHLDFGDAVRSICKGNRRQKKIFDIDLFEEFVKGYNALDNHFIAKTDIKFLYFGILIITYELMIRYLVDFLSGNLYFKVENKYNTLNSSLFYKDFLLDVEKQKQNILKILEKYFLKEL